MTILTLQAADKDTDIEEEAPTTNLGSVANITLDCKSGNIRHILMEFSIATLPAKAIISNASLSLLYYAALTGTPEGRTYYCDRLVRRDFVESQATWNVYYTGASWSSAGCNTLDTDYTNEYRASAVLPAAGNWIAWDVTNQVKVAQGASVTADFCIRDSDETGGTRHLPSFRSAEYATSGERPKLVITYSLPGGISKLIAGGLLG